MTRNHVHIVLSFDNFPISLWLADAQLASMILIFGVASVFDPSLVATISADDPAR